MLELSHLFWYPYHLWKRLSSGDIVVLKMFSQIFLLQRHLVIIFHKWKIKFKLFLIDFDTITYHFHAFWWPNQKKCLIASSRDTSLWKESTENLSVCIALCIFFLSVCWVSKPRSAFKMNEGLVKNWRKYFYSFVYKQQEFQIFSLKYWAS